MLDEVLVTCRNNPQNVFFRYVFEKDRSVFELCDFDFVKVFEKKPELLARWMFLLNCHNKEPELKGQVRSTHKKAE